MALNINGTTGISGVDGSATAPALQGVDSNTGVSFGTDTVNINTGGSTKATVDSSGKVGIGTTSPEVTLDIRANDPGIQLVDTGGSSTYGSIDFAGDTLVLTSRGGSSSDGIIDFRRYDGTTIDTSMRIDSSGSVRISHTSYSANTGADNLVVGNTSSGVNNGITILNHTGSDGRLCFGDTNLGDGGMIKYAHASDNMQFFANNSQRLLISSNGNIGAPSGSNIYNASDSRVKTNVVNLEKGLSNIKSLRPVSFNWIDGFCDEEKNTLYGFIAQEVQTVDSNLIQDFSQEITVKDTKIENVLRVNEKFIIPMLVKAIQELSDKIETLETEKAKMQTDLTALTARVTALEAA